MDNETRKDRRPLVRLPHIWARVRLPVPANFLFTDRGEQVYVGELGPGDASRMAVALAADFMRHWRKKSAAHQGLSGIEAEHVAVDPLDAELAGTIARARAQANGYAWLDLSEHGRRSYIAEAQIYAGLILTPPLSLQMENPNNER